MHSNHEARDWANERGEQWLAHLDAMEAMLAPVDEPLLAALQLDAPVRIADIACGGGATTRHVAAVAPAGSVVHGYDVAQVLVDVARTRTHDPAVSYTVADVSRTVVDAPYDRLVSRFGVMFFDDPAAAFTSLRRWLAPGGRFAFAVWGAIADNPWMTVVRDTVAQFVEVPPPRPDAPGPFRYGDPEVLRALLGDAGFADVAFQRWRGELAIGGGLPAVRATDLALTAFSVGAPLLSADTSARERGTRALLDRFVQHEVDGEVRLGATVNVFTGRV